MENDPRETMAELERAEAAPYVDLLPSPWWYGPFFGLYFAVLMLVFSSWASDYTLVFGVVVVVMLLGLFAVFRHMSRTNEVLPMPGRGTPPPEIARAYRIYFWSLVPLTAVLLLVGLLLPTVVAAVTAFVVVTTGFAAWDRTYARAAAAVRERLA